jgi:hypothetical protein
MNKIQVNLSQDESFVEFTVDMDGNTVVLLSGMINPFERLSAQIARLRRLAQANLNEIRAALSGVV